MNKPRDLFFLPPLYDSVGITLSSPSGADTYPLVFASRVLLIIDDSNIVWVYQVARQSTKQRQNFYLFTASSRSITSFTVPMNKAVSFSS